MPAAAVSRIAARRTLASIPQKRRDVQPVFNQVVDNGDTVVVRSPCSTRWLNTKGDDLADGPAVTGVLGAGRSHPARHGGPADVGRFHGERAGPAVPGV